MGGMKKQIQPSMGIDNRIDKRDSEMKSPEPTL
jgi:hypothetical protein